MWPRKPQDQSGRQGAFLSGPWAPPLPQTHPWPDALHPLQPVSKGLWLPGPRSVDPPLPLTVPAATVVPPHLKSCWSCPIPFWKYSEASQALGGAPKALSHLRGPPPLPDRPPSRGLPPPPGKAPSGQEEGGPGSTGLQGRGKTAVSSSQRPHRRPATEPRGYPDCGGLHPWEGGGTT